MILNVQAITKELVSNSPSVNCAVVLVNLLRSNLIKVEEYQEQPSEHIF